MSDKVIDLADIKERIRQYEDGAITTKEVIWGMQHDINDFLRENVHTVCIDFDTTLSAEDLLQCLKASLHTEVINELNSCTVWDIRLAE